MSIAVVFPGQGSQRIGMAKDFHDQCQVARDVFAQATEVLNIDMESLCFEDNSQLDLTQYTQPAILTAEIAMYRSLSELYSFRADYFAGHSLGEYSALVASGALDFIDAVQIVHKRGTLMQSVAPMYNGGGEMVALVHDNIAATPYQKIVHEHKAEISNINANNQVVISGHRKAVTQAVLALKKAIVEMKCIKLNVSVPFHCSIMKQIEVEFTAYIESFANNFQTSLSTKVVSNYTGDFYKEGQMQTNLVKQISAPVLWTKNMEILVAVASRIYEIGPNRPLTNFFASLDLDKLEVIPVVSLRAAKRIFST